MPIFEYTCEECSGAFELLIRGSETPVCPTCGSAKLEKAWSVPAAHSGGKSSQLPIAGGSGPMGCGLPQCGGGQCHMG